MLSQILPLEILVNVFRFMSRKELSRLEVTATDIRTIIDNFLLDILHHLPFIIHFNAKHRQQQVFINAKPSLLKKVRHLAGINQKEYLEDSFEKCCFTWPEAFPLIKAKYLRAECSVVEFCDPSAFGEQNSNGDKFFTASSAQLAAIQHLWKGIGVAFIMEAWCPPLDIIQQFGINKGESFRCSLDEMPSFELAALECDSLGLPARELRNSNVVQQLIEWLHFPKVKTQTATMTKFFTKSLSIKEVKICELNLIHQFIDIIKAKFLSDSIASSQYNAAFYNSVWCEKSDLIQWMLPKSWTIKNDKSREKMEFQDKGSAYSIERKRFEV